MSLLVLCLWGLEATLAEVGYFGRCYSGLGSTWHSGLFIHWLMVSHCLLALCAIGSALLIVHLIRHGGRLETSVLAASSTSAVVLTVIVDWLFGLFLTTSFQLPIP